MHKILITYSFQGYFEDRRPSSNCDPYAVTDAIVRTCCLGVKKLSKTYTPQDAESLRKMIQGMQNTAIEEEH
jgi:glutamine synthetase